MARNIIITMCLAEDQDVVQLHVQRIPGKKAAGATSAMAKLFYVFPRLKIGSNILLLDYYYV